MTPFTVQLVILATVVIKHLLCIHYFQYFSVFQGGFQIENVHMVTQQQSRKLSICIHGDRCFLLMVELQFTLYPPYAVDFIWSEGLASINWFGKWPVNDAVS